MKILIVDDDRQLNNKLCEYLTKMVLKLVVHMME